MRCAIPNCPNDNAHYEMTCGGGVLKICPTCANRRNQHLRAEVPYCEKTVIVLTDSAAANNPNYSLGRWCECGAPIGNKNKSRKCVRCLTLARTRPYPESHVLDDREDRMNLLDGLQVELVRNRELLAQYKALPNNAGVFGATCIQQDIERAEKAIASNDIVKMVIAYNSLKNRE